MSMLDDSSDLFLRPCSPERDRRTSGSCNEHPVAGHSDARRIEAAVNGPFRERGPGGDVETVDVGVTRQDKELLATGCPGKGIVII